LRRTTHDRVLKLPYRGAPQTVGVIGQAALAAQGDYSVRELSEIICAGLPSKDYVGEYQAFYYFMLGPHVRYMRDPRTVELVRDPTLIARKILAGEVVSLDCDDMDAFLAAMVLSVGGQVQSVTVAFRHMFHEGNRQFSHVFCEARDPVTGLYVVLDPVAGRNTKQMLRRAVAATKWPIA